MRWPWPPVLFAACLGGGLLAQALGLGGLRLAEWGALRVLGAGLILAGLGMIGAAILAMLGARTEIRPDRPAGTLLARGMFGWSRNPIYEGEGIALFGLGVLLAAPALLLAALLFRLAIARLIALEEAHLSARFGAAYASYCAATPRFAFFRLPFSRR